MDKADKKMFRTYAHDVGAVATSIAETAAGTKDQETRRMYEKWAEDLHFVTMDFHDTLDRI